MRIEYTAICVYMRLHSHLAGRPSDLSEQDWKMNLKKGKNDRLVQILVAMAFLNVAFIAALYICSPEMREEFVRAMHRISGN